MRYPRSNFGSLNADDGEALGERGRSAARGIWHLSSNFEGLNAGSCVVIFIKAGICVVLFECLCSNFQSLNAGMCVVIS